MFKEIEGLDVSFKKWQEDLLALPNLSLERLRVDKELGPNPLKWFEKAMMQERAAVERWKRQRNVVKQISSFIDATNTTIKIQGGTFKEDGDSDF